MAESFRLKLVAEWQGKECLQWAQNVLHRQGYLHDTDIDLSVFFNMTGNDLLNYSEMDFSLMVGHEFSALFYDDLKEIADLSTFAGEDYKPPGGFKVPGWPVDVRDSSMKSEQEEFESWKNEHGHQLLNGDIADISHNYLKGAEDDFSFHEGYLDIIYLDDVRDILPESDWEEILKNCRTEGDQPLTEPLETYEYSQSHFPVPSHPVEENELQTAQGILEKITTPRKKVRGLKNWEFLMRLLADPRTNPSLIEWEDEEQGIFRLRRPDTIAEMWASRREHSKSLSYNNFARGLRHHYKAGTLIPFPERHLVYKCGPTALAFLNSLKSP
ncbi:transcription factor Spi-C-like [Palaemon carinicauda]|uniref:transcription factor Spi-C-like n=1 Tax=Palaemon carinicauda TaxID=392227 RepID=UPI0035B631B4